MANDKNGRTLSIGARVALIGTISAINAATPEERRGDTVTRAADPGSVVMQTSDGVSVTVHPEQLEVYDPNANTATSSSSSEPAGGRQMNAPAKTAPASPPQPSSPSGPTGGTSATPATATATAPTSGATSATGGTATGGAQEGVSGATTATHPASGQGTQQPVGSAASGQPR
jgi:hypothetical protein